MVTPSPTPNGRSRRAAPLPKFAAPQVEIGAPLDPQWPSPEGVTGWFETPRPHSQHSPLPPGADVSGPTAGTLPTATSGPDQTERNGGDPIATAKVFAGLLALVTTSLAVWARRRSIDFRAPTSTELDNFTQPVARIAVRHLPMGLIGPDLADLAEAGGAVQGYAWDNPRPLLSRYQPVDEQPTHGLEEQHQ